MNRCVDLEKAVADFWNEKSCGEVYGIGTSERDYYESNSKARYELEPYILDFARFPDGRERSVLEIGVGMGADCVEWAKSPPRLLVGVDLTPRAIDHTNRRLAVYGLKYDLRVADAERLPFEPDTFDIVYSWGVLHHSPNTAEAIKEVHRVLRPGGSARIMIYHKHSLTGYMLWARYGLMVGRPFRALNDIYAEHLESPGTKAYSIAEARAMFAMFSSVNVRIQLSFGDLLQGAVGQRHRGLLLTAAKYVWPRWLIRRVCKNHGLGLLIEATK